ncbi:UTP--glucose-1-phosphate uridylyltransferase [Patescibacteria group bacterium]|nr:UTP--glucose-1-phosphate uridylyltransferase [Patescibacteria group bacterium]MBU1890581.1 UTP--glucose-1-phosphate uridylyltransferase [Patescibacteria group bacterium]
MKQTTVRKAVILVAGFGTRFLPATKALPKEMLPIIDTPGVQFAVEEAVQAGIKDIIFVTGSSKRAIEDHFDSNPELENALKRSKKKDRLKLITRIQSLANFIYVRQSKPLGTGHATLMAEAVVGNDPFVLMYPDDLIVSKDNPTKKMIEVYQEYESPVMGLLPVSKQNVTKYGIAYANHIKKNVHEVTGIIEKPTLKQAPSNLASLKGYVLPPTIFSYLKRVKKGVGDELWLADAVDLYNKDKAVFGCELSGEIYDLGSKLGWLKANVAFGLKHPELGKKFKAYLKQVIK